MTRRRAQLILQYDRRRKREIERRKATHPDRVLMLAKIAELEAELKAARDVVALIDKQIEEGV